MRSVIITGGGCEEAIDGVRSVTNFSSGKTSSALATFFADKGWSVTLLAGKRAITPQKTPGITLIRFGGFQDLMKSLQDCLQQNIYNAVIHAAAVSDFSIDRIKANGKEYIGGEASKISSNEEITIVMKPNSKILPQLKIWGSNLYTIGFKLTNNASEERRKKAVMLLLKEGNVDMVISNDLSEIDKEQHLFSFFDKKGEIILTGKNKTEMSKSLFEHINQQIEIQKGAQL